MRSSLILVFLAAFIFTNAQEIYEAKEIIAPSNPTTLQFENDAINFGEITEGDKVKVVYKFVNTGEEPLVIVYAKGSCGCTVPEFTKDPVQPGATGYIMAVFDSNGKGGETTKRITVTANTDPVNTYLTLKGTINKKTKPITDASNNSSDKKLQLISENGFVLAPNPASSYINITLDQEVVSHGQVELLNTKGETINTFNLQPGAKYLRQVDIQGLSAGLYVVRLQIDDKMFLAKHFTKL